MRILLIIVGILLAAGLVHAAGTVRVVTRDNAIRQECRFFSPVKAKVRYGDPLSVKSREGDWYRVSFQGASGCIHKSAVTEGSVKLASGSGSGRGASSDEVSLAGKGFNPQVEASYRNKHPELSFQTVDSIERYSVPPEKLQDFIVKGGLTTP